MDKTRRWLTPRLFLGGFLIFLGVWLVLMNLDARSQDRPVQRILVKDGSRVHIIPVHAIDYLEAQDDYVCVHTEGRKHLKQVTLSQVEADLDPKMFVRIHRSFILNIERLARIELYAKDSRVVILKNGTKLQVSRTGYARIKASLDDAEV